MMPIGPAFPIVRSNPEQSMNMFDLCFPVEIWEKIIVTLSQANAPLFSLLTQETTIGFADVNLKYDFEWVHGRNMVVDLVLLQLYYSCITVGLRSDRRPSTETRPIGNSKLE